MSRPRLNYWVSNTRRHIARLTQQKHRPNPHFNFQNTCRTNWYRHCQDLPLEDTKRPLPKGRRIGDGGLVTVDPSLKLGVEVMVNTIQNKPAFSPKSNIYAYCPSSMRAPLPRLRPRCAWLLVSKSFNNACAFPHALLGSQVLLHCILYSYLFLICLFLSILTISHSSSSCVAYA